MKRKFDPQKVLDEINEKLQRLAEETGGGEFGDRGGHGGVLENSGGRCSSAKE